MSASDNKSGWSGLVNMIFGAAGGPAVPIVEAAQGNKVAAKQSLEGAILAGTTAATIASLGTAAPAAGAADAAVAGAAADAGADTAATAAGVGAGLAADAGADTAASAAGAAAGVGAGGGVAGAAAAPAADVAAAGSQAAGAAAGTAGASSVSSAVRAAGSVDRAVQAAAQKAQPPVARSGIVPSPGAASAPVGMQAANFASHPTANPEYNAIFGAPPTAAPAPGAGSAPPSMSVPPLLPSIQPSTPPPLVMSDQRVKANVQPAARSVRDFLTQIYEASYGNC